MDFSFNSGLGHSFLGDEQIEKLSASEKDWRVTEQVLYYPTETVGIRVHDNYVEVDYRTVIWVTTVGVKRKETVMLETTHRD